MRTKKIKKSLGKLCNRYALEKLSEFDLATSRHLLESAEMLLSSLTSETESAGLLATTYLNLSYVCKVQGDLEDSLRMLEKANSLEQKTKDLTGNLITKINKSAILFELEAYQEAYIHAKEVITLMEPKINEMMRKEVDAELKKNKIFIQNLNLILAAYLNLISALEQSTDRKHVREAEDLKNYAIRLSNRFLEDKNQILNRLRVPISDKRSKNYNQISWDVLDKNPESSRDSEDSSMYRPDISNTYYTKTHMYKRNEKLQKQVHMKEMNRVECDSKERGSPEVSSPSYNHNKEISIVPIPKSKLQSSDKPSSIPSSKIPTQSITKEASPLPTPHPEAQSSEIELEITSPVITLKRPASKERITSIPNPSPSSKQAIPKPADQAPTISKSVNTLPSISKSANTLPSISKPVPTSASSPKPEDSSLAKSKPVNSPPSNTKLADPPPNIITDKAPSSSRQSDRIARSPTLIKPSLDLSSSISSAFVTEPSNPYRLKFILMPGQKLPEIPFRPTYKRDKDKYKFSNDYLKDYTFLLDSHHILMQEGEKVSQIISSYGNDYAVCCSIVDASDPSLLITTKLIESPEETIIPESLKISDLKSIINYVMIRDVLPYDVLIPFINNFVKFSQYFLLPFIRVGASEEEGGEMKKIELWGQALGLLPQEASRVFLRTVCRVSVFQISTTTLRMVLSNSAEEEYGENCLRVDLFFDETAACVVLKQYEGDEPGTTYLTGLKPLDMSFLVQLDPIITELELWVKDEYGDISLQSFIDKDAHIVFRSTITSRNLDKTLWIVYDDLNSRAWHIRAKNLPNLNSSGRRRKYEATYSYSYLQIIQNYGVKIDTLDKNQRQLIAYYVLQSLRFNDVESGMEGDADEDMENEPMITVIPISIAMSKRYLLEKGYKIPLTLSLIGIQQMIIGVRATILDTDTSLERGCLFPIDGDFYKPKSCVKAKLSKIPALERLHSISQHDTRFGEILEEEKGWKRILNVLQVEGNGIYITDLLGQKSYMDSLENVLYKYKA